MTKNVWNFTVLSDDSVTLILNLTPLYALSNHKGLAIPK